MGVRARTTERPQRATIRTICTFSLSTDGLLEQKTPEYGLARLGVDVQRSKGGECTLWLQAMLRSQGWGIGELAKAERQSAVAIRRRLKALESAPACKCDQVILHCHMLRCTE